MHIETYNIYYIVAPHSGPVFLLVQNIYLSRGPTRTMWNYQGPVFDESVPNYWTVDLHITHGQHP